MLFSEGNALKHKKIDQILKKRWIKMMEKRKGILNSFPDYEWLKRHQGLDFQKTYRQILPIKKGRVIVDLVRIIEIEAYSKEFFAFDMAFNIIQQIMFHNLRSSGYGYDPEIETDYVPFVDLGIIQTGIEIDSTKVDVLTTNLKSIFQEAIKKALDNDFHTIEVKKQRLMTLDSPINYSTRFRNVFQGLFRFGEIIRSEDLDKIMLSITPEDIKKWLEDFAENPGNIFIVGDIK